VVVFSMVGLLLSVGRQDSSTVTWVGLVRMS
jgi:hypothetical protein